MNDTRVYRHRTCPRCNGHTLDKRPGNVPLFRARLRQRNRLLARFHKDWSIYVFLIKNTESDSALRMAPASELSLIFVTHALRPGRFGALERDHGDHGDSGRGRHHALLPGLESDARCHWPLRLGAGRARWCGLTAT